MSSSKVKSTLSSLTNCSLCEFCCQYTYMGNRYCGSRQQCINTPQKISLVLAISICFVCVIVFLIALYLLYYKGKDRQIRIQGQRENQEDSKHNQNNDSNDKKDDQNQDNVESQRVMTKHNYSDDNHQQLIINKNKNNRNSNIQLPIYSTKTTNKT